MWTGAVHQLAKFHCDILNSCGDRTLVIFVGLARKHLIRTLFGRFFGIWSPKWGTVSTWPPKTSYDYKLSKLVQPVKERKEQKIHRKKPDTGKLAVRPGHPHCHSTTWICVCGHIREVVIYSQFHWNPFKGILAIGPGVEICPLPLTWPVSYIQQRVRTSCDDTPI